MRHKLKSDSKWNELTEEQQDTLEGWLFEETITYREALERVEKEFGITASISSLARFYQHLAEERLDYEMGDMVRTSMGLLQNKFLAGDDLHYTVMTLVANRLIQIATQKPGNVKELVLLSRVLVANEAMDVRKRWLELEVQKRETEHREKEETKLAYKEVYRKILAENGIQLKASKPAVLENPTTLPP